MRAQSELEIRILDMIEPVATEHRPRCRAGARDRRSQTPTLQIMAELPGWHDDGGGGARGFSRAISPVLEAEDPISSGVFALKCRARASTGR
jgi:ribosome maturation factor RimP